MNHSQVQFLGKSSSQFGICLILTWAVIVRVGVLLFMGEGLQRDTDAYRRIAETVRRTGTLGTMGREKPSLEGQPAESVPGGDIRPTAFRPPLYPLLLALLVVNGKLSTVAVAVLHVCCGVLTVWLVWRLGWEWGLGKAAGAAAIITACDPILVYQSTQLMTETVATLCAAGALWGLTAWWVRPSATRAIMAGLLLGLACLCRPTFLPWTGLVVVTCAAWQTLKGMSLKPSILLASAAAALLIPWGFRNYVQLGTWKFTTTHGGYTLLLGNNPRYYEFLRQGPWHGVWKSEELDRAWARRGALQDADGDLLSVLSNGQWPREPGSASPAIVRSELEDDQLAYAFAKRYIREDWSGFLLASLHRIGSFWHPLPHAIHTPEPVWRIALRWGTALVYLVVFVLAARGIWNLREGGLRIPWVWGFSLCFVFTAVHTFYWSNMRMRAPLMPVIALWAAAGIGSRHGEGGSRGVPADQSRSADSD